MSRECLLYYLILWPYTIQSMIETVLAFEIVVTSNYILERKTRGDTRINNRMLHRHESLRKLYIPPRN